MDDDFEVYPFRHPSDDDFQVYPFRRQLVEDTLYGGPLPQLRLPPPPVRAAPRRRPNPLKWAIPAAVAAFLAAVAGAATIAHPKQVQQVVEQQIVPAAAAAPEPRRQRPLRVKLVFVPDVTGLTAKRAVKLLEQSKFRPRVKRVVGEPGVVLEQKPAGATEVKKAGVVRVVVGKARPKPRPAAPVVTPTVIVTSVVGLHRDVAVRALKAEGLGVRVFGVPSSQPAGTVVAQAPKSGSRAEAGGSARINVSIG